MSSNDIYTLYNIDKSKLKRDYIKNPLKKILINKHYEYELPNKEDLEYLYIKLNLSILELTNIFNTKIKPIKRFINKYNIIKPISLIVQKRKSTNIIKYDVDSPIKNNIIKEKIKQTNLEKYGVSSYAKLKNWKKIYENICTEKYGVKNVFQLKNIKEKSIQTCLKKYGVKNYSQSLIMRNYMKQEKINIKRKEKEYQTKKKNNTFNTSKPEEEIYKLLVDKFGEIKRQYKSDLYPFNCDFYIPNLDLYIEYQGWWGHRKEPYIDSVEQQEIVKLWESKGTKQYLRAIGMWTNEDIIKRQTAKNNNLNWIEFFNINQFMDWYLNINE